MDRRNGGDPQAPPRPPKLFLPRVHRPRAPEPMEILNETSPIRTIDRREERIETALAYSLETGAGAGLGNGIGIAAAATTTTIPQCTNSNQQQQQQQQQHLNCSNPIYQQHQQQQLHSITAAATSTLPSTATATGTESYPLSNNIANNSNNSSSSNDGTFLIQSNHFNDGSLSDYDRYQIHHLTYLPERPSNLSRTSSHISTSSSSSITAANSFTRRRLPLTPGAAIPLITITGTNSNISNNSSIGHVNINANGHINVNSSNSNSNSSSSGSGSSSHNHSHSSHNSNSGLLFNNQFQQQQQQQTDSTAASAVTLAQPRPESQRLTNEYVETPLRTTQHLQHASRIQHPAGQQDNAQTTTHHVLLLPQRELRQQQQQHLQLQQQLHIQQQLQLQQQHQQQHQTHSSRAGTGTAGTAIVPGPDGTDGFLHSQNNKNTITTTTTTTTAHHGTDKALTPPPPPRNNACLLQQFHQQPHQQQYQHHHLHHHHHQQQQQQQQQPEPPPITKQPARTSKAGHGDLLDIHSAPLQDVITTANHPTGTSISGSLDDSPSITCQRCGLCRCDNCKSPRALPEKWLCNKTCLCSAESIIDYTTCLCCAKALFYHCANENDMEYDDGTGTPCLDNPCSCSPYKRIERWGWLGALSLLLPCLCCYWPLRGCSMLCQKCYSRFAGHGCHCHQSNGGTTSVLPIVSLEHSTDNPNINTNIIINGSNSQHQVVDTTNLCAAAKSKIVASSHNIHHFHHHHHHHHNDIKTNRISRKSNVTPEKRLLDSTVDY